MQMIEWWIMLFLIKFEKNYTVGEIVFLQNNTSTFKQKEKRLIARIKAVFISFNIVIITSFIISFLAEIPGVRMFSDKDVNYNFKSLLHLATGFLVILTGIFHCTLFCRLYNLMRARHNFEFQRTKRTMQAQFIVVIIYYSLGMYSLMEDVVHYFLHDKEIAFFREG